MADKNQEVNATLPAIATGDRGLQLMTITDMRDVSQIILQSNLAPEGYTTKEQIFVGLQTGAEIGLKPMQALNSIAVIRGKPTLWGDAALGLVKRSGLLLEFSETITGTGDSMMATVKSTRKDGDVISKVESTFSVDDAKTANLWGKKSPKGFATPWITHPKRMLKYKARAFNLRDNFPDVLMGLHLTEELIGEDLDEPLPAPVCDVPPRGERRKLVDSQDVDEAPKPPVVPDKEDTTKDTQTDDAVATGDIYDEVVKIYTDLGGTNFIEFAADILCRDEDELDREMWTEEMVGQVKRHLATEGI